MMLTGGIGLEALLTTELELNWTGKDTRVLETLCTWGRERERGRVLETLLLWGETERGKLG
jgi:hypothetical protein